MVSERCDKGASLLSNLLTERRRHIVPGHDHQHIGANFEFASVVFVTCSSFDLFPIGLEGFCIRLIAIASEPVAKHLAYGPTANLYIALLHQKADAIECAEKLVSAVKGMRSYSFGSADSLADGRSGSWAGRS